MDSKSPEVAQHVSQFHKLGFYDSKAITLTAGSPRLDLLRMLPPMIEAATKHRMEKELQSDAQLFQYGTEEGNWDYRVQLAKFLSEEYGNTVKSEQIFLTGGASCGLWLVMSAFFKPGSIVFVEDPSYFYGLQILKDAQVVIVPIKTDDDGIVVEDLQAKLVEQFSSKPAVCNPPVRALMYLIPTFHNPTGSTLASDRCRKIIGLARRYGITIICDDVYNLLHYGGPKQRPNRLFSFDKQNDPDYVGNVISNGSFSKFLGPGLRMGWLEAPNWAVESLSEFGVIGSGGGINTYTSGIITSLIELGMMKKHLLFVRESFKNSMDTVLDLLQKELPEGCKLISPGKGGYFLWIKLPENVHAKDFLAFCKETYNMTFLPGQNCSVTKSFPNYIRICISFNPLNVLVPAVKKLCQAVSIFQSNQAKY